MAIKAKDQITIVDLTDVQSVTIYYLLQTSTLSAPSQPVTLNPDGWSTIEPAFTDGATNTLYTCVKTLFKNGDFSWGDVSVSSSYEAAKSAYNQAIATNQKLTNWCDTNDMTLINGAMVATGTLEAQAIVGGSITSDQLASNSVTTDKLIANTVTADKIDINDLFAQDITATGTISGMKLRGQQIDIQAKGYESETYIRTIEEADEYILEIGNEYGEETALIGLTPRLVNIGAPVISIYCTDHFEANCITNTYTSFDGNVVSGGSVTVVKKLGWCLIHGSIKPNDYIGDWAEVLPPSAVPAPQHGSGVYTTAHYWGSSYTRPLRIGIGAGGSLRIEYGSANSYTFAITYPIE